MSARRRWACAALCAIGLAFVTRLPAAQSTAPTMADIVAAYRRGEREAAIAGFQQFLRGADGRNQITSWASRVRRAKDVAAIQAALLLHAEAAAAGFKDDTLEGRRWWFIQVPLTRTTLEAARAVTPRSEFLRRWYLLWESVAQGAGASPSPMMNLLSLGLLDFPRDPEVLLAAGAREEMLAWRSSANPRRLRSGGSASGFHAAAHMLRRSVERDPSEIEASLRLGRTLFLSGDLEGADRELQRFGTLKLDPGFTYLGWLFRGELWEGRGENDAAARAYRSAVGLVPNDQSARLALTQLIHKLGDRAQAADEVVRALNRPLEPPDPYWIYLRGQWWRYGDRLAAARESMRP